MTILLTNDDGIFAEGLHSLYQTFKDKYDITIVAPLLEQSSQSHSLTLNRPLTYSEIKKAGKFYGYAVEGTPADAVKFALKVILDDVPELIISGINQGANLGTSILYSGTIAAAYEGLIEEIPSVAISLDSYDYREFSYAAEFALSFVNFLKEKDKLLPDIIFNVNIPALAPQDIKGAKITSLSRAKFEDFYEKRVNPRGMEYFWIHGMMSSKNSNPEDDYSAIKDNYISITPLEFKFSSEEIIEEIKGWNFGLAPGSRDG